MRFLTVIFILFFFITTVTKCVSAIDSGASTDADLLLASIPPTSSFLIDVLPAENLLPITRALSGTQEEFDNIQCRICTGLVSNHIIVSVEKVINNICTKSDNFPKIKAHCQWIATHYEFHLGWIIARLKPNHDAYLYCLGKDKCPIHGGNSSIDYQINSISSNEFKQFNSAQLIEFSIELLNEIEYNITTTINDDDDDLFDVNPTKARLSAIPANKKSFGLSFNDANLPRPKPVRNCQMCYRRTISDLLLPHLMLLDQYCKNTGIGSPPSNRKQYCNWVKLHPQYLLGSLIGTHQPERFTAGYCIGTNECKCKHSQQSIAFGSIIAVAADTDQLLWNEDTTFADNDGSHD